MIIGPIILNFLAYPWLPGIILHRSWDSIKNFGKKTCAALKSLSSVFKNDPSTNRIKCGLLSAETKT